MMPDSQHCLTDDVATYLGLYGVGGQQHGGLGGAVDILAEDGLLHLQVEEVLGGLLYQLLGRVLGEELHAEMEVDRLVLWHVLIDYLAEK